MKNNKGFSLIEMMISLVIASLMMVSVFSIYANQSGQLMKESQRDVSLLAANHTYDLISRLIKQAQENQLSFSVPDNATGFSVSFNLPLGFSVWPNDVAPYTNNTVKLTWYSSSDNEHKILLSNANYPDDIVFAGDNSGDDARIVDFNIWPMKDQFTQANAINDPATNGYLISITTRSPTLDIAYINPVDGSHYRTHTVSGVVSPRN